MKQPSSLYPLILLFCMTLFLIVPFRVFPQWNNRLEGNISGKVRTMKLTHWKVIKDGDSLVCEKAADNDPFWFRGYIDEKYIFNREGRTTEYHAYFTDEADDNKISYLYNKEGLLIEQRYFADRKKTGSMTYEYDTFGKLAFITRYDEKGRMTDMVSHIRSDKASLPVYRNQQNLSLFKYDADGKCIEEKNLKANGRINYKKVTEYDDHDRKTRIVTYDGSDRQQSVREYDYDKEGRVILVRDTDDHTCRFFGFVFDGFGNETTSVTAELSGHDTPASNLKRIRKVRSEFLNKNSFPDQYIKEGLLTVTKKTESIYTYDNEANWIQRIFFIDDQPEYIQKREYVYWK